MGMFAAGIYLEISNNLFAQLCLGEHPLDRMENNKFRFLFHYLLNISEFNKLQEVHRNGWKEYMNGSKSSQAQAERDKESVIAALVSELDETRISYITKLING